MAGGLNQYLDYCPRYGCIAVEFTRAGKLVRAWPYRPDLLASKETVSLPYEAVLFRFTTNVYPIGLIKLAGGDLVVTFQQWNTLFHGCTISGRKARMTACKRKKMEKS
jgi:hypothetical protein